MFIELNYIQLGTSGFVLNAIRVHAYTYVYKYSIYVYFVLNGLKSFQYPEKMDVYLIEYAVT